MKNIIVTTVYKDVSDADINFYCKRLESDPLLKSQNVGINLLTLGHATFETPPAIGSGNAISIYTIEESNETQSTPH